MNWHFDALAFEDHTVTFPSKKADKIANRSFIPVCDPDGDSGTMPDEPSNPDAKTIDEVCPGGPDQIEFAVDPLFGAPSGNGVAASIKDFENSGIQGANVGVADAPYEVKFTARTEKHEPYTFICMVHPFMRGKVIVT